MAVNLIALVVMAQNDYPLTQFLLGRDNAPLAFGIIEQGITVDCDGNCGHETLQTVIKARLYTRPPARDNRLYGLPVGPGPYLFYRFLEINPLKFFVFFRIQTHLAWAFHG